MNGEQAAALRKPFDPKQIGKLPKGGVQLDYVGHAATTDRLLSVDPSWSWEPVAVDQFGNPMPDAAGNLWIRLTVCGVTRYGVGDGKTMKERIGDAIRNAAMRFGVALDLWSKEELEQSDGPKVTAERGPEATTLPPAGQTVRAGGGRPSPPVSSSEPITEAQVAMLGAVMREAGLTDRDERLAEVVSLIGRDVSSSKELTKAEASKLISHYKPGVS